MSEPTMTEVMDAIRALGVQVSRVESATTALGTDLHKFRDHVFDSVDKLGTRVKALEVELEVSEVRSMNGA